MEDCLFCKIARGEMTSDILYEDDTVLAFRDISPQAPIHFLVISKIHIASAADICAQNSATTAHIFEVIARLAREQGFSEGFRTVTNVGENGGQSVRHLHFHVLAGRPLSWPPG